MITIIYNHFKIVKIMEASKGGITNDKRPMMIISKEDAKIFFEMKGYDTTPIDKYQPKTNNKPTQKQ